ASTGRPALERCLAISAEEFAATYWSVRPLLSPAQALPADFGDLFSADAVDDLLSTRGLRTPFLRLATQGSVLDPGRFTRSGGLGAGIADQVADDKVLAEFAAGATLVLQGLHRTWPPLVDFAQQLSSELGHPVQVNAYVTPGTNRGFDPHYDVHDVLVLQIAGEKRWTIHRPVHEHPLADQPWTDHREAVAAQAKLPPVIDAVLQPGDALYLPRGWLHSAQALGETTIHLTVGMHATTRYDVLQALVALAADTPELRASLPLGVDPDDPGSLAADLEATVKAVTDRLGAATAQDAADAVRRRILRTTRPEPLAPLAQARAAETVAGDSVLRLRRHSHPRLAETADGQVRVTTTTRDLTLPASCRPALEALLGGSALTVRALPGLDEADACALATRLLREGIAVPG
ncbi:MAG: cupin domain-containing protein, partial [Actinomycetota bacterium]|nr:cupin domain-containing protein [Actinomycetota bacterium]